jgi:hypothetical protein
VSRLEQLREVAWLEALAAAATEEAGKRREALRAEAVEELKTHGHAASWPFAGIGRITLNLSKDRVECSNPDRFQEWVEQRYPDGIQTVTSVSSSWRERFFASVDVEGDRVVDPETGEIVPGLLFKAGGKPLHLTVKVESDAKKVLALSAGEGLKHAALVAGPSVPVVLAELEQQ